ncbi:bile acid:sodium symporter family protein [Haloferax mediterranei ATCC 33500]|uniref:Bile acid:sodium symporter n=1 Tax=Haloferax mediterranei (strain ATCC 33500 / DSM 1411 / JCM 8866 / NBRC 14739 / NCIMB 2177 / R-4) TaxID=523841 RepID=I3R6V2_HALMT|nr:bile acid:sodium symporter family protein [Haloferax mediterranei]AFK19962.1 sodium-dependent transporter [Haloferax mediterranei ATCC 33500]AHZ23339.1 bile acid:sodium symporter [Haloferax mediterranei ATCC 33500]ELZ99507.1 sodium-dependent transporter [Haloferax mediterranei ATCC 33500]MDX5987287.1 bile acid:sodium symporter family protein [Haloferax mediterranei ATCC 33500]QCQ73808.1 bile acid:sodium symporter family protein [Haloferax mediterranei ATCC 33500]
MTARSALRRLSDLANTYFVGLVLLASATALVRPGTFTWIAPYISPLLGVIMLGMGLTLRPVDFRRLAERPRDVAIGAVAQWVIMPVAAYALTVALSLPPAVAVGVILVGAAPGGTASNVMAYLGKGDVALSVAITTVTTLAAPLVMPAWVVLLAGEQLQVGFVDLFVNILQIVFIPVVFGFALRLALDRYAPEVAEVGLDVFPLVSVVTIVAIVAAVVGLNVDTILGAGVAAIAAVVIHNAIGLSTGYGTGRLADMSDDRVRTTTFEVGLQNSGLAAALALSFFSPAAALPPALFSVWHNITGPLLASYFSRAEEAVVRTSPADD